MEDTTIDQKMDNSREREEGGKPLFSTEMRSFSSSLADEDFNSSFLVVKSSFYTDGGYNN